MPLYLNKREKPDTVTEDIHHYFDTSSMVEKANLTRFKWKRCRRPDHISAEFGIECWHRKQTVAVT